MTPAPTGLLLRGLIASRRARLLAVDVRALADHTRALHGLDDGAAVLGAQTLVAAALSSAHIKGDEQLTLQIQGSRPRCAVYVDATADGTLRARVTPPDLAAGAEARLDGALLVTKHAPGGELYRGATAIAGATLEAAIGAHFGTSQQIEAVVRLGCRLRGEAFEVAHGLLIERLPDEPGAPAMSSAEFTARFGPLRAADLDALQIEVALGQIDGEPIEILERTPVRWRCRCSRDKIVATLASLGAKALDEMIREDNGAQVDCHFCTTRYAFSGEDLAAIALKQNEGRR